LYTKLRKCLEKFWRITKGYHGDLHTGNIIVVHDGPIVKKVRLIDYGSHKKFKAEGSCFNDFVKIIDKEFFEKHYRAGFNTGYFPASSKIKVVFPKRGQPIRPNTNILRSIRPQGTLINKNFSSSLMSKINPMNNESQIKNYLERRRYMTEGRLTNNNIKKQVKALSHKHVFMSPRVYNKLVKNDLQNFKNEASKNIKNISFTKLMKLISEIKNKNSLKNYISKLPNNKKNISTILKHLVA
jgi:hypothetical protein